MVPGGPLSNSLPTSGGKDQDQPFRIAPAHPIGVPGTLGQVGTPGLAPRKLQHSLPLALLLAPALRPFNVKLHKTPVASITCLEERFTLGSDITWRKEVGSAFRMLLLCWLLAHVRLGVRASPHACGCSVTIRVCHPARRGLRVRFCLNQTCWKKSWLAVHPARFPMFLLLLQSVRRLGAPPFLSFPPPPRQAPGPGERMFRLVREVFPSSPSGISSGTEVP